MMDTISSEADSHIASNCLGDNRILVGQNLRKIDPDYMERLRAVTSNSTQDLMTNFSPSRGYDRLESARNEYKIGEIPPVERRQGKRDILDAQIRPEKNGTLILASRPQNYESLSLTNSTEFG